MQKGWKTENDIPNASLSIYPSLRELLKYFNSVYDGVTNYPISFKLHKG